jgi:1,2-diacylglycerol 3-alpha-glucosyltransferase
MKTVILAYQQFGPYHRARLRHSLPYFQSRGLRLVGLEIFERQLAYEWDNVDPSEDLVRVRLDPLRGDRMRWSDGVRIVRAIERIEPSCIFVNGWGTRDAWALYAYCVAKGVARVIVSDSSPKDSTRSAAREFVKSMIVRNCSAAFVAGRPHVDYVKALGVQADSIFEGCDAIDNAHFAISRPPGLSGRRLLTVARLEPQKNLLAAADAFLAFVDNCGGGDWSWHIAGYGSLEAELQEKARSSEGRLRLLGKLSYTELPAAYLEADLYWQPSLVEPWGLAVNEAMASGLPILVSEHCGCVDDLVDANTGWIFDPTSQATLISGLQAAFGERDRWSEKGRNAQRKIAAWGLDRFAEGALKAAIQALGLRQIV